MEWIKETFGTVKPIIAMCHVRALPGDPYFDADGGMEKVVDMARAEFLALQEGGVDAVMFSNEFSLPYLTKVEPVTTACMARVIGELKSEIKIPFGVNMLWGTLSSKNNPYLAKNINDPRLLYFPGEFQPDGNFKSLSHVMDKDKPYVEVMAGIHNIFKIFHIEYVRRLNYKYPGTQKWGIRGMFRLTF